MEALLKFVVARTNFEGLLEQIKTVVKQSDARIRRKTMGGTIDLFLRQVYSRDQARNLRLEGLDTGWLSVSLAVDADESTTEERKSTLRTLLLERNVLIHRTIAGLDITDVESCTHLAAILDEQYERILPEHEYL